jgi:thioredoxin reductase
VHDVVIVGGGPAGLSAALILGRCCRRVVVIDAGHPRNAPSKALHGFLTRDGIAPQELRRIARDQLSPYEVELIDARAISAKRVEGGFEITLDDGRTIGGRRLLLATGVADYVPQIDGLKELYGRSVFHCPYCDGWEVRRKRLAAYAEGHEGADFAQGLVTWSSDVVLLTGGGAPPEGRDRERLERHGIPIRTERVARLEGDRGKLARIVFESGPPLERDALFFHYGRHQASDLALMLGCKVSEKRGVERASRFEETDVPGVFVAGDASYDVLFSVIAAAEGAKAAYEINRSLRKQELRE